MDKTTVWKNKLKNSTTFAAELNQKLIKSHIEHMAPNETAMTCKETAKAILGVKTQQQKWSA